MQQLTWNPIYKVIEERTLEGDEIILIIAPFIKYEAIKKLLEVGKNSCIKVICRWAPNDLISSVSDISIYPFLKEMKSDLYINPNIHLKLYIFESNNAFSTSANLTCKGMGYSTLGNIETGSFVSLTQDDWHNINQLLCTSRLVDDTIFNRFSEFLKAQPKLPSEVEYPNLLETPKEFTIASLPAFETPTKLADFYYRDQTLNFSFDEERCAYHDLDLYNIAPFLPRTEFNNRLSKGFLETTFVIKLMEYIKERRNLRFGEVNGWIHEHCEDVPLPYRWEVRRNTHILYDWLSHFIPEISWDVPGQHSQVIYWNDGK